MFKLCTHKIVAVFSMTTCPSIITYFDGRAFDRMAKNGFPNKSELSCSQNFMTTKNEKKEEKKKTDESGWSSGDNFGIDAIFSLALLRSHLIMYNWPDFNICPLAIALLFNHSLFFNIDLDGYTLIYVRNFSLCNLL